MIAFFKLMSMVLGLARDMVIAHQFGAKELTDAYVIALRIPNMVFYIIGGALVAVVIPVFTEYVAKGKRGEAWKVFNTVVIVVTLIFIAFTIVGLAGAPILVKLVAPGFDESVAALTVELVRLILPLMIFAGLASLFSGLLNANNIFGLPAFSNSVNNIFIIISAFTLGRMYGIHGLALGTVLAMIAMALVQFPALIKIGFRLNMSLDLRHPGVRKVYYLALPAALGVAVNQANVYINGVLASWLPEGSISALSYAERLVQFPVSLFVLALGTAVFPTLSARAAEGNREALSGALLNSLKAIIICIVPAGLGLMALSLPIVTLVYKRGAFDQQAVEMTAAALLFYAIGLVGQAAGILLTRGFYSLQDTRTPVKIGIITVLINLGLSLVLIRHLLHAGLALAGSLASLTYMALLLWGLGKKVPGLYRGGLLKFTLAVLAASGIMAVASYAVYGAFGGLFPGTAGLAVQVGLAITAGVAVYVAAIFALRVEEAGLFWQAAKKVVQDRLNTLRGK